MRHGKEGCYHKELQGQITNTVNCFRCEEAIGAFCSLACFDLFFIWQHLFPFLVLLPLYQFSGCNEPMQPMRCMFYQANGFVTTSYNQSCSTEYQRPEIMVSSHLAKEGNTILKTKMNERGLQSTARHQLGKETAHRIWYKPEPVTNQSSRNEHGHIYDLFGSEQIKGREGKSSCGLTPQTTKDTRGL